MRRLLLARLNTLFLPPMKNARPRFLCKSNNNRLRAWKARSVLTPSVMQRTGVPIILFTYNRIYRAYIYILRKWVVSEHALRKTERERERGADEYIFHKKYIAPLNMYIYMCKSRRHFWFARRQNHRLPKTVNRSSNLPQISPLWFSLSEFARFAKSLSSRRRAILVVTFRSVTHCHLALVCSALNI